jgi:hypothetical protein
MGSQAPAGLSDAQIQQMLSSLPAEERLRQYQARIQDPGYVPPGAITEDQVPALAAQQGGGVLGGISSLLKRMFAPSTASLAGPAAPAALTPEQQAAELARRNAAFAGQ